MILADTDVLIDALRGHKPVTERIALEIGTGRLATTTITVFELMSGARTKREQQKIQKLLGALQVLPFDSPAAEAAAASRRELQKAGMGIGTADYLIAGICLSQSAILLTRNRKHFSRVEGLKLGRVIEETSSG